MTIILILWERNKMEGDVLFSMVLSLSIEIYLELKKRLGIKKNYSGWRYQLHFYWNLKSDRRRKSSISYTKRLTFYKRLTSLNNIEETLLRVFCLFNLVLTWNTAWNCSARCYLRLLFTPILYFPGNVYQWCIS